MSAIEILTWVSLGVGVLCTGASIHFALQTREYNRQTDVHTRATYWYDTCGGTPGAIKPDYVVESERIRTEHGLRK